MAVIAFSGATHDIACDGVYMAELNKEDQAKYIGVQGAFYNVAKLVANGGLVAMAGALAEHFGAIEGASIDANKGAYSSAWMIIFARNCGNNGTDRYLSYKDVAFYTGSVNNKENCIGSWARIGSMSLLTSLLKSIFFITSVLLFYIVWQKAL